MTLGIYEILPSSYAKIPYEGKQGVVFQDSLENEVKFTLQQEILNLHKKSRILKHNPYNESEEINFCYYNDSKQYQLYSDSLKLSLSATLSANPYYDEPLKEYVADQLVVSLIKIVGQDYYISTFHTTIDQRTFPDVNQNVVDSIFECFGKEFLEVEHQQPFFSQPKIHFNLTEGIVSFKDETGKKWRFERFE